MSEHRVMVDNGLLLFRAAADKEDGRKTEPGNAGIAAAQRLIKAGLLVRDPLSLKVSLSREGERLIGVMIATMGAW